MKYLLTLYLFLLSISVALLWNQVYAPKALNAPETKEAYIPDTSGPCHVTKGIQDRICSPGDILTNVTQANIKKTICSPDYMGKAAMTEAQRLKALEKQQDRYGIATKNRLDQTLEMVVPLQLGGTTTTKNLWPMPEKEWSVQRSAVIQYLLGEVCAGRMKLKDAQNGMRDDWKKYIEK